MAGGIVMTALGPIALLISGTTALTSSFCSIDDEWSSSYSRDCNNDTLVYGSLLTGVVLIGVGIPLIVIGAKKEPERQQVVVAPWATPTAGGVGVRFAL